MKVHALILGNIAPLSGCEIKNSKVLEMEFALVDLITCEDQPAPRTVSSAPFSRTKHLTFCRARSGPELSATLVCHSLLGGVPSRPNPANSISRRQRDRVMVHGLV